jgi:mono/diheme cytochrome c family protein
MIRRVQWALIAVALWLWPLGAPWAQPALAPGQDPVAGSRVFQSVGCAKCHAVGGVGGKVGPDLAKASRPRTFQDLAAAMWNHLPHMTARMQQMGIPRVKLDAHQAADLVAYLYSLHYFDPPGRADAGKRLFTEKKCIACHQVDGRGGTVGPSMDAFKQFASPLYVASAMWNHGPQMAEAMKAQGIERPTLIGAEIRDLIAFLSPATTPPQEGPVYVLPGRAEQGRLLLAEKGCVQCHPLTGTGVGPSLTDRAVRRSQLEFAATLWNKAPAMQAARKPEMGPPPQLSAPDMADLVAYLDAAGYFAAPGRISRGWKVMVDKGCLVCHGVYGERGKTASDLTRAKGLDSQAAVLASLWNHTTVTAPAPGGGKSPWPTMRAQEMSDLATLLQAIRRAP